jgi:Arc/MetJ-type ribon-helix-helix transcriptional regulator
MKCEKIAITMEPRLVRRLDGLVKAGEFANRSQAIQLAVQEKLARFDRTRLARECAKLDPGEEQALADQGLSQDAKEWPEY